MRQLDLTLINWPAPSAQHSILVTPLYRLVLDIYHTSTAHHSILVLAAHYSILVLAAQHSILAHTAHQSLLVSAHSILPTL